MGPRKIGGPGCRPIWSYLVPLGISDPLRPPQDSGKLDRTRISNGILLLLGPHHQLSTVPMAYKIEREKGEN